MDIKNLTSEQIEKARACKTSEELLALAKEYGVELTDEQLEAVSGGSVGEWMGFEEDGSCDGFYPFF